MKLGYVGLGKMGFNMVLRLLERGHEVVAFDVSEEARERAREAEAQVVDSLAALAQELAAPRFVWVMVPHKVVEVVLEELTPHLSAGDTVIDGGNSNYKETMRRAGVFVGRGFKFLDVGVSGGPVGARTGACLMVGGEKADYEKLEPLFRDLAVEGGCGYMGRAGAGHFVKMVHNGIEYGMMQAIGEGFAVMRGSDFEFELTDIARVYDHGSVIESRLVGWLRKAYEEHGEDLDGISGSVSHSGEGLWTVEAAKKLGIPVPIIKGALDFRVQSEERPSYTGKVLSALRNQFGGHSIKKG